MRFTFLAAWLAVLLLLLGGAATVWQRQRAVVPALAGDVLVAASFYPLAEFARQAGGGAVNVFTVVPSGSEPHDYEPTPQELVRVYAADVFLYNGGGIDPWAERIAPELRQRGVQVMDMSSSLQPEAAGDGYQGPEVFHDPHFWLDPVLAQEEVRIIAEALTAADSAHAAVFRQHSQAYQARLQRLDQDYRTGLASCARREVVTSHNVLGYVAARYALVPITIAGLSPDEEPSAQVLAEIAELARKKDIRFIFFETLVSSRLAQTVAAEIGAQTLVFNPLEGLTEAERQAGEDYLSVMRTNLQNLRIALECN